MNTPSTNGELADSASSSGRKLRSALKTRNGAVGTVDADVHVQAERVVPPDDVAQELVVSAVVRRVDDPLLLPAAPRMRAGGREPDAERVGERAELRAALADALHAFRERLATAGAHLGLRRDQLADEMRFEFGADRGLLHVLEAVRRAERARVDECELFLDRDREVGNRFERGPRGASSSS